MTSWNDKNSIGVSIMYFLTIIICLIIATIGKDFFNFCVGEIEEREDNLKITTNSNWVTIAFSAISLIAVTFLWAGAMVLHRQKMKGSNPLSNKDFFYFTSKFRNLNEKSVPMRTAVYWIFLISTLIAIASTWITSCFNINNIVKCDNAELIFDNQDDKDDYDRTHDISLGLSITALVIPFLYLLINFLYRNGEAILLWTRILFMSSK